MLNFLILLLKMWINFICQGEEKGQNFSLFCKFIPIFTYFSSKFIHLFSQYVWTNRKVHTSTRLLSSKKSRILRLLQKYDMRRRGAISRRYEILPFLAYLLPPISDTMQDKVALHATKPAPFFPYESNYPAEWPVAGKHLTKILVKGGLCLIFLWTEELA